MVKCDTNPIFNFNCFSTNLFSLSSITDSYLLTNNDFFNVHSTETIDLYTTNNNLFASANIENFVSNDVGNLLSIGTDNKLFVTSSSDFSNIDSTETIDLYTTNNNLFASANIENFVSNDVGNLLSIGTDNKLFLLYNPPPPHSGVFSAASTGIGIYPEVSINVPVGKNYEVHAEARMSTDGGSTGYIGIQVDGVKPTDNRWIPGEDYNSDTLVGSTTAYHSFILEGRVNPYIIRSVVYSDYQQTTLRVPWNNGVSASSRNFIRVNWYSI